MSIKLFEFLSSDRTVQGSFWDLFMLISGNFSRKLKFSSLTSILVTQISRVKSSTCKLKNKVDSTSA